MFTEHHYLFIVIILAQLFTDVDRTKCFALTLALVQRIVINPGAKTV